MQLWEEGGSKLGSGEQRVGSFVGKELWEPAPTDKGETGASTLQT